ncbi:MAG: hypothetical protein IJF90_06260 [Synergistaceae bacterium]|nr:hypothetical protein [Synergistaceae bacterium]
MDFNSIGVGSPFYILHKSGTPVLYVGTVKEKGTPQAKYQPQAVPNAFNGLQQQTTIAITATVEGKDETFADLPTNVEIAQRGDAIFSGSREAMLQCVDGMMQASRKALEQVDYHKSVITEGEKMLEVLNPRYAEEKMQTETIRALKEKQQETDKTLKEILDYVKRLDTRSGSQVNNTNK